YQTSPAAEGAAAERVSGGALHEQRPGGHARGAVVVNDPAGRAVAAGGRIHRRPSALAPPAEVGDPEAIHVRRAVFDDHYLAHRRASTKPRSRKERTFCHPLIELMFS